MIAISKNTRAKSHLFSIEKGNGYCTIPNDIFNDDLIVHPNKNYENVLKVKYKVNRKFHKSKVNALLIKSFIKDKRSLGCELTIYLNETIILKKNIFKEDNEKLLYGQIPIAVNPNDISIEIKAKNSDTSFKYCKTVLSNITLFKDDELTYMSKDFLTDKGAGVFHGVGPHLYTMVYNKYFNQLINREPNILEIGLDTKTQHYGDSQIAPSLFLWKKYFKNPNIVGFDINNFEFIEKQLSGCTFIRGNQCDRKDLSKISNRYGIDYFDIIIDDGSHRAAHQQVSLVTLLPLLKPGGLYCIEDLFWDPSKDKPSTLEFLTQIQIKGKANSKFCTKVELKSLFDQIKSIQIYRPNTSEIAIITKK